MDIKLKKLTRNPFSKAIAFLLCIVLFMAVLLSLADAGLVMNQNDLYYEEPVDLISSESYTKSNSPELLFYYKMLALVDTIRTLKSEENIIQGKTVEPESFDYEKKELFYDEFVEEYPNRYYDEEHDSFVAANPTGQIILDYDNADARKEFETAYASQIGQLRKDMIESDLWDYRSTLSRLDEIKGFYYYVADGNSILTNVDQKAYPSKNEIEKFFQKQVAYRIYHNGTYTSYPDVNKAQKYRENEIENYLHTNYGESSSIYMAYDSAYLKQQEASFKEVHDHLIRDITIFFLSLVMSVVLLIYLMVTTGKKKEDGSICLYQIDRWFTEIQLGAILFTSILGIALSVYVFDDFFSRGYYNGFYSPAMILFYAGGSALAALGLFFILSLVRKIKAKRFLADFILWRIVRTVFITLKELYHGSSAIRKVAFALTAICVFSASVVMMPVVLVLALLYCIRLMKQYEEVKKGIREVKNGNLEYKINMNGNGLGEFEQIARDINDISEGFDLAVKQELKNQRLKTELISNVSHDIKTPLTSIITYVDLLKKEGLDAEEAPKYLEILDQKSIRLKKLTEDLFEAAKASSGDMPVNIQEVELLSLINQGLGEMNDRFEKRGLEVIIKTEKEKHYVLADGKLLWRVVENLFVNIIKYAQKNSRVYIDLKEEIDADSMRKAVVEVKNVSENPLNIPAEELLERFKRGDASRSTEGSGLGLSIARDLMQIQGAEFDVVIDGDLFKAILKLDGASREHRQSEV